MDLCFLPAGQPPPFLDEPAHLYYLEPLVLRQGTGLVGPLEKVEPLRAVEGDSRTHGLWHK